MKPTIFPYKLASQGAKNLAKALTTAINRKVFRVRKDSRTFVHRPSRLLVNWGNAATPNWLRYPTLNKPKAIVAARNKLLCFQALKGECNIPEFTTVREEAQGWDIVVCRHLLSSYGGKGIQIVRDGAPLPDAPLYVKYKKKRKEFRVHVFKGRAIDVQEKRRERGVEREGDMGFVRNRANGWVFCRDNIIEPDDLREQSILAVKALGLDFGAVDIIWNERENKSYVLEVNTAPGLEGTTLQKYTQAILECL